VQGTAPMHVVLPNELNKASEGKELTYFHTNVEGATERSVLLAKELELASQAENL
jgi:hypothetical protein